MSVGRTEYFISSNTAFIIYNKLEDLESLSSLTWTYTFILFT